MTVHSPLLNGSSRRTSRQGAILVPNSRLARANGLWSHSKPLTEQALFIYSSVQFNSRWYPCARKSPNALHPVSQKFPQRCLCNVSVPVTMAVSHPFKKDRLKPVLNWTNVCSPEHTSDTSTNYDSFLNWTFSSPNMVRTVQTLLHSQLACNEMQASARTCGRRAADSMIENVG